MIYIHYHVKFEFVGTHKLIYYILLQIGMQSVTLYMSCCRYSVTCKIQEHTDRPVASLLIWNYNSILLIKLILISELELCRDFHVGSAIQ